MSLSSDIDRESFETFLANAFAVQKSGLNSKSLSAVAEIQRLIGSDDFDLDRAMQVVAEQALPISGASGIAIALLEKDELVYRAGSGSAAKDIGRRVPAVLSVTSTERPRREILRVENAGSDTRIEAEICRQFGAISLLMLPIYGNQVLAGVLQVLSEAPHHFDDHEVRTYRLMIAALENGMLHHAGGVQKHEPAPVFEQMFANPVAPELLESAEGVLDTAMVAGAGEQDLPAESPEPVNIASFENPLGRAWLTCRTILARERSALWMALKNAFQSADIRNAWPPVGVAVALSIALWISERDHLSTPNLVPSAPAAQDAHLEGTAQPISVKDNAGNVNDQKSDTSSLGPGFRRVRVGPYEVDEISEDVTIRYFDIRHGKPITLKKKNTKEVQFGDDVTVRYFADVPGKASRPGDTSQAGSVQQTSFQSR